jgi:hypothetical protein
MSIPALPSTPSTMQLDLAIVELQDRFAGHRPTSSIFRL